jgi:hypothetical protein
MAMAASWTAAYSLDVPFHQRTSSRGCSRCRRRGRHGRNLNRPAEELRSRMGWTTKSIPHVAEETNGVITCTIAIDTQARTRCIWSGWMTGVDRFVREACSRTGFASFTRLSWQLRPRLSSPVRGLFCRRRADGLWRSAVGCSRPLRTNHESCSQPLSKNAVARSEKRLRFT